MLAVYPTHPFAGGKAAEPARLLTEPMIIRERDSGTRRVVTHLLEKHLDLNRLKIVAEMGSTEAVRQGVKAEVGIALLLPPGRGRGYRAAPWRRCSWPISASRARFI